MYEIILYNNGIFEVNEVEFKKGMLNSIYTRFGNPIEQNGHLIYCKLSDDINKYKKRLLNYLIKDSKQSYDLAKKEYNRLKKIKDKISC